MWRYAAAKATGVSHQRMGLPCQDRFACDQVGDGTIILALADGAGSASMAEHGAELAVQTVVRVISSQLRQGQTDLHEAMCEAVLEARQAIRSAAQDKSVSFRELASTLLAVAITPDKGVAAQIGDGLIVVRDQEDAWCWVFWPQHGEFVNTTRFLTDDDAMEHAEIESLPPTVYDLVLLTDGLERLALDFPNKAAYGPFFTGLINPLVASDGTGAIPRLSSQLETFLCSERITSRADDDVSLILATCRPQDSRS